MRLSSHSAEMMDKIVANFYFLAEIKDLKFTQLCLKPYLDEMCLSLNMHSTPHGQNICIHFLTEQPTIWREVQVLHEGFVYFEKGLR